MTEIISSHADSLGKKIQDSHRNNTINKATEKDINLRTGTFQLPQNSFIRRNVKQSEDGAEEGRQSCTWYVIVRAERRRRAQACSPGLLRISTQRCHGPALAAKLTWDLPRHLTSPPNTQWPRSPPPASGPGRGFEARIPPPFTRSHSIPPCRYRSTISCRRWWPTRNPKREEARGSLLQPATRRDQKGVGEEGVSPAGDRWGGAAGTAPAPLHVFVTLTAPRLRPPTNSTAPAPPPSLSAAQRRDHDISGFRRREAVGRGRRTSAEEASRAPHSASVREAAIGQQERLPIPSLFKEPEMPLDAKRPRPSGSGVETGGAVPDDAPRDKYF